jgi:hypothetical protein
MTISSISISKARILAWFNSMNKRTSVSVARTLAMRLNSMNGNIGSRGVYLSIADEDGVAGDEDADGDAAGGDSTRSSISGGGTFLLKMPQTRRWRRRRLDTALWRRATVKVGSSRAKSASQKPYLSSPGAGSQVREFRRSARPVTGARRRLGWINYGSSATTRRGKLNSSIGSVLPCDQ